MRRKRGFRRRTRIVEEKKKEEKEQCVVAFPVVILIWLRYDTRWHRKRKSRRPSFDSSSSCCVPIGSDSLIPVELLL